MTRIHPGVSDDFLQPPDNSIDIAAMEQSTLWVERLLLGYMGSSKVRKFKDCGVDLNGSPGLPFKGRFQTKGSCYKHSSRSRELGREIDGGRPGRYDTCWDGFPKVEILPFEKASRKSRLITASSAHVFRVAAKLYSHQNEMMSTFPHTFGSSVGMVGNRGDWNRLASKVTHDFQSTVDEADAKTWDAHMYEYWLRCIYRIRWNLLDKRFRTRRNWLRHLYCLNELIFTLLHLPTGEFLRIVGGNKSGQWSTCHDNTIGHLIACAYAWIRSKMGDFNSFVEHARALFGDDKLTAHLPKEYWDAYMEFGIEIPEDGLRTNIHISEAKYLSQGFLYTPYGYMPYPNWTKGVFSAYHCRHKRDLYDFDRLRTLWLQYFWTPARPFLRGALEVQGQYCPPDRYAILHWSSLFMEEED